MFLLRRPSHIQIQAFYAEQRAAPWSYPEVGWTRNEHAPAGYRVDRWQVSLGRGADVFERAGGALRRWAFFEGGPVRLTCPPAFEPGALLVLYVRHWGIHSLNANRVVYVLNEHNRFGFAYGTLTGHAEQGEERFLLSRDASGTVWFSLYAFSRPRSPLARLGAPAAHALQRRAAHAYLAAMQRAVGAAPA